MYFLPFSPLYFILFNLIRAVEELYFLFGNSFFFCLLFTVTIFVKFCYFNIVFVFTILILSHGKVDYL